MDTTRTDAAAPAAVAVPSTRAVRAGNRAILLIALFKLSKALVFFIAASGMLRMIHRDTGVEVKKVLHAFRLPDDGKIATQVLLKAKLIDDPHKRIIGGLLAFTGILFAIEGTGLFFRKRWAEYFTVIMTSIPLPYEVYHLLHRTHNKVVDLVPQEQRHLIIFDRLFILKLGVLALNVAIVWFLIYHLRRSGRHHAEPASAPPAP